MIVNNQIGFTTAPSEARSHHATPPTWPRCSRSPIFHVNGEDPEAVAQVVELAMDFRREFRRDVVIDMYCYRRHGHNEGDEPAFTQPLLYEQIASDASRARGLPRATCSSSGERDAEDRRTGSPRTRTRAPREQELSRRPRRASSAAPHAAVDGVWAGLPAAARTPTAPRSPTGVSREAPATDLLGN